MLKHLGFLVSSTKHVKDMKEEMDQLNLTEKDIQHKKNTADLNFLEVSHHVSPWLEDVAKMKEKVQSIPTAGIGCFNVAKRYKAGKQSCVLVEQIKALKERASEISWTNERKSLAKVASTSAAAPHGTQTTFESRESVFNVALQSLQSNDESQKMIALCGMGGVGKTTMMEQLKKAVEDSKMFDWVVLGESTDPHALQQAVAEYIHQDLKEKNKEVRAELLRKKFEEMSEKGQKKILVIMDDIWREVDLKDVGLTSPLPNGFKLLFTSRFEYVCTQMGVTANSILRVPFLNDAEAKKLFFEIVGLTSSDGDHDEFQKIGEDIVSISEIPLDFNYPNLSLLIMMDGDDLHKFPLHIYEKNDKLEVASYEEMGIPLLPTMFEHSTKLRTLCLRSCLLNDDISFLGSLSNLEALSIVDCGLRRLPSMIGMLKKLKLLDLTGCADLRIDDGVLQNLHSLEELYMRADEYSCIMFTDANCEELEILSQQLFALELEFFENKAQLNKMSFEKLERFRISIGSELVKLEDDKKYSFKNTIKFVGDCNELLECKISELFEETEELHLKVNDMNHLENVVSMHHSFSSLKVLYVSGCKELTYLFTVAMLQNMVSLCRTVIELPELVKLKLDFLPNFTSISPDSSNPGGIQSLLNKEVVIPKLEKLKIDNMEKLKQIWPCQIPTVEKNNVSMLRDISVRRCSSLTNIFPDNPLPMLNNLEELTVWSCGSIEVIFNIDFENVSEMEGYISRLRSIRVKDLKNLTEIWRMRGVSNSSILINGFQGVQSITIHDCKRFKDIFTPVTTNFDLRALIDYTLDEWNVKSEVDDYTCHHLKHLQLLYDERVEVVFDMDRQLATIQPQLLLPYLYLESINLWGLREMSHVWKRCNWNKFLIPQHQPLQFPFQNLTNINLYWCPKIKYLFSPLMAKYLSNLNRVEIYDCNGIEEVISRRDDEHEEYTTSTSVYPDTTLFPHLDTLDIGSLPNLKSVDDGDTRCRSDQLSSNITNTIHDEFQSGQVIGASWSFCQYFRTISVEQCDALSSLIPWYAVGQMKKLQELEIKKCSSMTEVFECESINNVDEGGAPLRNVTVVVVPQLSNLKSLSISECDRLPHIFTFSTLETLHHLKEFKVERCNAMQVIVEQENRTSSDCVTFPRLETLKLEDLPNLKGFFLGMNDFRWPSLAYVLIKDCPKLMMFTYGQSTTPKLKYIQTSFGKYSPACGLNFHGTISQTTFPASDPTISKGMPFSFHNLIEINIKKKDVGTTIIPSHALRQLQKLQQIHLFDCKRVKELQDLHISHCENIEVIVKQEEEEECDGKMTEIMLPRLNSLRIKYLPKLKGFCLGKEAFSLPLLETLEIESCSALTVFTNGHVSTPELKVIYTRVGILEHEDHMCYLQGFIRCDNKRVEELQLDKSEIKALKMFVG
ncbi:LOW QUALITY PROTEIN: hypothetical protein M8C21_016652 [Ambrosia artemisiifolia]|uniref:AAA+ ATPase domain-containing protein n=1 Tax=Ambrosia artemisiifolia TaxID=4212 RepID=A0AAD5GJD3_AMBAR|nr:LOW QUALITY PROTEIN: hypothetical protein M8C21_016652 [Ambrosia artemisiifolia]